MEFACMPIFITSNKELTNTDKNIYFELLIKQEMLGVPLTKWEQFYEILEKVNVGRRRKLDINDLLKSIKKMEKMGFFIEEGSDVHSKFDVNFSPIFKRSIYDAMG